jgi:hypothetical protein
VMCGEFCKWFRMKEAVECRGVAQPGSAPALGAGGRVFESHRPDHHSSLLLLVSQLPLHAKS